MTPLSILFLLIAAHALCDYPLQGQFLAAGKNHRSPLPGVPWPHALAAHALIHGGAVALVTGSPLLGMAETIAHAAIDWAKCDGRIGYHTDQALHLLCKVAWVILLGAIA